MNKLTKILAVATLTLAAAPLGGCGAIITATNNATIRHGGEQANACAVEVANRPEYASIRSRRYDGEISATTLSDNSLPTSQDARLMVARWDTAAPCRQIAVQAVTEGGRPDGAQILNATYAAVAEATARFSKGDVTWGQYAQVMQAIKTTYAQQVGAADAAQQQLAEQRQAQAISAWSAIKPTTCNRWGTTVTCY